MSTRLYKPLHMYKLSARQFNRALLAGTSLYISGSPQFWGEFSSGRLPCGAICLHALRPSRTHLISPCTP